MKRCLVVMLATILVFACAGTQPKDKNSAMLMGYVEVFIGKEFGQIRKGTYLNNNIVRVENVKTGKVLMGFTQNGYFTIYNIEPGIYSITRWKLEIDLPSEGKTYFHGAINPEIKFTVKPGVVNIISKVRSSCVPLADDKWDWSRTVLPTKDSEMEVEFKANPKNQQWLSYKKNNIDLK